MNPHYAEEDGDIDSSVVLPTGQVISMRDAVAALLSMSGGEDDDDDAEDAGAPLPDTTMDFSPEELAIFRRCFDWESHARDPSGDGDQTPLSQLSRAECTSLLHLTMYDANSLTVPVRDLNAIIENPHAALFEGARQLDDLVLSTVISKYAPGKPRRDFVNQRISIARHTPLMVAFRIWAGWLPQATTADARKKAMERGRTTVMLLLEAGADVNARDLLGNGVVWSCVQAPWSDYGPAMMLPELVARGLDLNARNRFGLTPMLSLLDFKQNTATHWQSALVQAGADPIRAYPHMLALNDPVMFNGFMKIIPLAGLKAGDKVILVRNGQRDGGQCATVQPPCQPQTAYTLGRYAVKLEGGGDVTHVHMREMRRLGPRDCARCAKPDARSRCSRCKLTAYCGRECQVAHYKEHRVACEAGAEGLQHGGLVVASAACARPFATSACNADMLDVGTRAAHPPGILFIVQVFVQGNDEPGEYPMNNVNVDGGFTVKRVMIIDEKNNFAWMTTNTHAAAEATHEALARMVLQSPTKWFAFYRADYQADGNLRIYPPALPPQPW